MIEEQLGIRIGSRCGGLCQRGAVSPLFNTTDTKALANLSEICSKAIELGNSVRSDLGQSEINVTTEPWSAVEWIADADLTRASFYWDSVSHC